MNDDLNWIAQKAKESDDQGLDVFDKWEQPIEHIVLESFVDYMNDAKTMIKVLQDENMACIRCDLQHDCEFAFDPYNFNTEPKVDCLAAK